VFLDPLEGHLNVAIDSESGSLVVADQEDSAAGQRLAKAIAHEHDRMSAGRAFGGIDVEEAALVDAVGSPKPAQSDRDRVASVQ